MDDPELVCVFDACSPEQTRYSWKGPRGLAWLACDKWYKPEARPYREWKPNRMHLHKL